jgi:O-acetyl-ADP-ribose deacetylase (regulator of RNase III)
VQPEDRRARRTVSSSTARTIGRRTLALCSISTGVFGYPKDRAAEVALRTVSAWLVERPKALDLVVFCVFSEADRYAYDAVTATGWDEVG